MKNNKNKYCIILCTLPFLPETSSDEDIFAFWTLRHFAHGNKEINDMIKKQIQNKHMNEGRRNIVYDLKIRWKCNKPKKEYCGTNRSINQSIWGHTISGTEYTVWVWMCLFSFIPLNYQFYHLIIFLFRFVSINKLLWDERTYD